MNGDIVNVCVIVNLSSIPALCLTLFLFHFISIQSERETLEHSMHHDFSMEVGQELALGILSLPRFLVTLAHVRAQAHTRTQTRAYTHFL